MIFPGKDYQILYIDPPWEYGNYNNTKDLRNWDKVKGVFDPKYKITPYPGMSIEEIKGLPVQDITAKNCALCLWVTMPCIQWGLDVCKAWGFDYKTVLFTWVKRTKNTGQYFTGLGNYTRANAELCLLGVKGSMKVLSKSVPQVVDTPVSSHSKKPDVVRKRIIELFGDLKRIELFARTNIHGWETWGNDEKLKLKPIEAYLS